MAGSDKRVDQDLPTNMDSFDTRAEKDGQDDTSTNSSKTSESNLTELNQHKTICDGDSDDCGSSGKSRKEEEEEADVSKVSKIKKEKERLEKKVSILESYVQFLHDQLIQLEPSFCPSQNFKRYKKYQNNSLVPSSSI